MATGIVRDYLSLILNSVGDNTACYCYLCFSNNKVISLECCRWITDVAKRNTASTGKEVERAESTRLLLTTSLTSQSKADSLPVS
jgi:hypothetical protein